ncbi:hypothetical protein BK133_06735 [Paenibacillus sp. FSL H8-0548]|uniref:hypothetical protein n=1 Tax=Paenibacillus sp. FSL H8-0548 TaxID=1920422 RepID=UPI00096C2E7B|nr:hypothetical protein [Paenibacillus sp. FSL H8-0548]OMF37292.1 hypothetical protein BK133_06735 [Paenibacillus sp. FSL H8-0548]
MLSFEQKLAIIEAFPELQRKNVSLGRTNFHYEESLYEKKSVVHHLHPNGNGYVFAGLVPGVATDEKGLVNIRDYSEDELRSLIEKAIQALALAPPEKPESKKKKKNKPPQEERWIGPNNAVLTLLFEEDLWYLYADLNLESAFETYEEAVLYLEEEQFTRA